MTGFFGPAGPGRSSFDDFLAQFFGAGPTGRRAYPVDITSLLSDQARGDDQLTITTADSAA